MRFDLEKWKAIVTAKAKKVPWWGWTLAGVSVLLLVKGRSMIGGAFDFAKEAAFTAALPTHARQYAQIMLQVGQEVGVSPALIFALGDRESGWGLYLDPRGDPGGTGDNGHGHGIMQIDDRSHSDLLADYDWTDPLTNVRLGMQVFLSQRTELANLLPNYSQADLDRAAIVAYNHGVEGFMRTANNNEDWDSGTTGGNYSADVIAKRDGIIQAIA